MPSSASLSSSDAERRLVRKLDWHILPWICVSYLINYLDRVNLGNARTLNNNTGDSLNAVIGLTNDTYALVVAAFFIPYVLAEPVSVFMMKKYSPSTWIARIMFSWGIVSGCQAAVKNVGSLVAVRVFLGLAEAGFYPCVIFYLTFWYRPEERAQRMAIFAGSVAASGAFSGLLATGISFLNGKANLHGWQWLFILEAIPAILLSVAVYFYMPDFPDSARFLTEEERALAVERLRASAAPSKNDKTVDWQVIKNVVFSINFWLFALAYFFMTNSLNAVGFFLPSLVSNLGFSGWRGQAMTVPPYVFACIVIVCNSISSDRRRERILHSLGALMLVAIGYILLASTKTVGPRLVGVFFIACTNAAVIPFLAFRLSTVSGSTATAMASGGTIAFANLGGITAPYIFSGRNAAPLYRTGNFTVFAMQLAAALIIVVLWYRLGRSAYAQNEQRSSGNEDIEDVPTEDDAGKTAVSNKQDINVATLK